MKKILILGAGYSGVLTAKKLEKKLGGSAEITIIDKNPFHTMLTELHEVAAQRVDEESIKIDLKRVFAGRKVNVVLDTVISVDYENKQVNGQHSTYEYDYMVMASGSKPTYFGVPGAQENAFVLWSYEDAVKLREQIMNMFRQAVAEPDQEKRRRLLTFYVVGAGFTGAEMAGELAELVPYLCKKFEIEQSEVSIYCVDTLDRTVPVLPPKLSQKVQRRMEKMGVNVMLNTVIVGVGPDYIEYKSLKSKAASNSGKREAQRDYAHTIIWTVGVEGSGIVTESGAALGAADRGRIQTDEYLRSQNDKNVYVVGDNVFFIPEGEETPVPQMVENAEASAHTAAHNIIAAITGKGEMEKYAPSFHGVMLCIGSRYGVANVGTAKTKFALPSFLAMFCKHFINVFYFVQVLGWNKVFSYLKHEFFTVRNCRSFVGGHLSNRTPSFMLVPLRVFLGLFWLYQGLVKISEGWLSSPKLTSYIGGATGFYESLRNMPVAFDGHTEPIVGKVESAAVAAADAVSSASEAFTPGTASDAIVAELTNPLLLDMKFFGFVNVLLVNAGELAIKIQIGLIDAFTNNVVLSSDSAQMAFQTIVVISEVLIGLALIGGLFTILASGYSLMLQGMFLTSTGLFMSTWWMPVAAIAVLFGGGRVFGLDYWVLPVVEKWWKKIRIVKKWYIYHD